MNLSFSNDPAGVVQFFIMLTLWLIYAFLMGALYTPLPLGDSGTVRYRTVPTMTLLLIFTNVVLYFFWQFQPILSNNIGDYGRIIYTYGFRPSNIYNGLGVGAFTTFTSMFMHGGPGHLVGNMFYLWTFGRRVEDACGSWRFLLFYLLTGMLAHFGSVLLHFGRPDVPSIGASGAISGVMGAFLILFPTARIICLWGVGAVLRLPLALVRRMLGHDVPFWRWRVLLPAWTLLVAFAIMNVLPALDIIQQGGMEGGGVNYIAHVAGFFAAVTIVLFVRKDLLVRMLAGRSL